MCLIQELQLSLLLSEKKILNNFGFKSLGSEDVPYDNPFEKPKLLEQHIRFKEPPYLKELKVFTPKSTHKIMKSWRWWMQSLDRSIPFKKYTLPADILLKFEGSLTEKNIQFIEELENSGDEIK